MASRARPQGCCPPSRVRPLADKRAAALTALARALSDRSRLEILRLVAAQEGPICACDIVAAFALSQPTVSHHLAVLRDAGLVASTRRGLWVFYAVTPAARESLQALAALV